MQALEKRDLRSALNALGEVLASRGLSYDLVLAGGACLLLRGVVSRATRDVDLLAERLRDGSIRELRELPEPLATAAQDVARTLGLAADWLNLGPGSLLELGLPDGFENRLSPERFGGLTLWLAGESDLVCFKLYAAADHWPTRDRHLSDLVALAPSPDELLAAARWCRRHDPTPAFRTLLTAVLQSLGVEDADDELR